MIQDGDKLFTKTLDIHRSAGREVAQQTYGLRRAAAVDATDNRLFIVDKRLATARRTQAGHLERLRVWTAYVFRSRPDDLRDHVPGALDDNEVSLPHVLFRDNVCVVQGGLAHRDAPHENRVQNGVRV